MVCEVHFHLSVTYIKYIKYYTHLDNDKTTIYFTTGSLVVKLLSNNESSPIHVQCSNHGILVQLEGNIDKATEL